MPRSKIKIGDRFSRLIVIADAGMRGEAKRHRYFVCQCDCGSSHEARGSHLTSGGVKSCGCLRFEGSHHHLTPTYQVWGGMIQRCRNPKNPNYSRYGGRGIVVCERWLVFENFLADMGPRPEGRSIGRIDGNKGYEPSNCRWETPLEQGANYSTNHRLTFNGETHHIAEWSRITGIGARTIWYRIRKGKSAEEALTAPVISAAEASRLGLKTRYGKL